MGNVKEALVEVKLHMQVIKQHLHTTGVHIIPLCITLEHTNPASAPNARRSRTATRKSMANITYKDYNTKDGLPENCMNKCVYKKEGNGKFYCFGIGKYDVKKC